MFKLIMIIPLLSLIIGCKQVPIKPYIQGHDICKTIYLEEKSSKYKDPDYKCIIGYQIPGFTATTTSSKLIDPSYFKNKVSIITFWGPKCAPCLKELPVFHDIQKAIGQEKLNYLSVATSSFEKCEKQISKFPDGFDHIVSGRAVTRDAFQLYFGYPYTIIVDKNLTIVEAYGNLYTHGDDKNIIADIKKIF